MGSVEPVSLWTAEDDLHLRNAVEAGASLEALARGAVRFSRRYSLEEVTERWRAMLFDMDTSIAASERILKSELLASSVNRSGKGSSAKGKESSNSKKRETPTLRSYYYAMRKRICSEPRLLCDGFGGFLPPAENGIALNDVSAHVRSAQPGGLLGAGCQALVSADHYHIQGTTGFDHFPDVLGDVADVVLHLEPDAGVEHGCAVQTIQTEQISPLENSFPSDEIYGRGGVMYDHEIDSMFMEKEVGDTMPGQVEDSKNFVIGYEGKTEKLQSCLPEDLCPSENVAASNQQGNTCLEYADAQHVKTEAAFEYPSSASEVAMWGTASGSSMPSLPADRGFIGKEEENYVSSEVPVDGHERLDPQGCTGGPFEPLPGDADGDFMDIQLDDEVFFQAMEDSLMDADHFDGLSNFLINSPIEGHQVDGENKEAACLGAGRVPFDPFAQEYAKANEAQMLCGYDDGTISVTDAQIPHTASMSSQCYEPLQGPVYCPLNTEVQEIPCNDHIILPIIPPIAVTSDDTGFNTVETCPSNSISHTILKPDAPNTENKEQRAFIPQLPSSPKIEEKMMPEFGLMQQFRSEADEISNNVQLSGAPMNPVKECIKDLKISPAPPVSTTGTALKEEVRSPDLAENGVPGPTQATSTSNQEEKHSDGEDDVPSVSDVEAMILDMDLLPYDEELTFYPNEASIYRTQEYKKKIMRWEQSFHSCMQRAIVSRGALALFYGRRLKHYLKKPQVLIGRSTGEVDVDIDLRIEGCANRISRRQAVIMMDAEGCFHLKNLAKYPIIINGQEVDQDKCCRLSSGCCIEIRGLSFMFEVNKKSVREHLSNTSRMGNKVQNSEYDCLPGEKS